MYPGKSRGKTHLVLSRHPPSCLDPLSSDSPSPSPPPPRTSFPNSFPCDFPPISPFLGCDSPSIPPFPATPLPLPPFLRPPHTQPPSRIPTPLNTVIAPPPRPPPA
ncbi:hypothetical protein Pcinc_032184 [Petrolisthes cinctipes]|uniref:Uncharacterized protein n=1 Tax=Petrolisthes cinctipes TaxID=88211 RepID=A0AAE1EUV1_PETCI|nr:hypothetical protein Pcinc_032184 [Petrolisthes cinctipes]